MNEIMVYNIKQFELKLNKGIESLKQNQIFKPQYDQNTMQFGTKSNI